MPDTICPRCHERLDVEATDIGQRVACPACGSAFTAREVLARPDEPSKPRRGSRAADAEERSRERREEDYSDPEFTVQRAQVDLRRMGRWFQVVGVINLLIGPLLAVGCIWCDPPTPMWPVWTVTASGLATLAIGIVQIIGGRHMVRVKWLGLCLTTATVSIIPVSYLAWVAVATGGLGGMNLAIAGVLQVSTMFPAGVGMLVGLVTLWTLLKADVRRAFRTDDPDDDAD